MQAIYIISVIAVGVAAIAILACAPKSDPPSPQDIQVIETESTPAAATDHPVRLSERQLYLARHAGLIKPTRDPRLSDSDAQLVDDLIECYKTNAVIWGATKGAVETRLAEAGNHQTLIPEDMRFFLVSAALVNPKEFRTNENATLVQCAATGR